MNIGSLEWYEMHPDAPSPRDAMIDTAIVEQERRARVRQEILSLSAEKQAQRWDRLNAESIAKGWGPLPF